MKRLLILMLIMIPFSGVKAEGTCSKFELADKEIETPTGTVYKQIINNSILGSDAWLNVSSGLAWSSIAKNDMTYDQAMKFCREELVTDSSLGLKCRLPSDKEYQQIGYYGDNAYEILPNFKDRWFWSSRASIYDSTKAYFFDACRGLIDFDNRSSTKWVRCVCDTHIE